MNSIFRPASRIEDLAVSEILAITARAAALRRDGRPVITLGAGEPDFDTPDHIKEAAIWRGEMKYTNLDGSPRLKRAIRDKFARENDLDFAPDEVTAGAGARQMLYNAMMASLDPGDEVIIPTPCWTSYFDIVRIAGGVPSRFPARARTASARRRRHWRLRSPRAPDSCS